ncbi:pyridoxamine 5'-phosphate oxidase family protein [Paraburkholderia fynbosensis]|uniref:Flavohemoprotein n=1 Tax=Paraburkholderia fynbosensis TaxID=1200993 RepID=A0A6J5GY32_9BURK|nr:pyridoxamine 5'-phosphate oxidase family protein [Paraburkholderia fynbosensis]CAB3805782.1 Flavohemoprotein [Paraburkholderia fynbosensis]
MSAFVPLNGWGVDASPFHAGEVTAQQRAGVTSQAESAGRRGIRRYMPEQHRQFFADQPFVVFGGVDANGQPWATLRAGKPGFVSSPDAKTLRIDAGVLPGDPLAGHWQPGAMIGGLGLQPQTRRRNRVNGVVRSVEGETLFVEVTQSFGNCAKYIQSRTPTFVETGAPLACEPEVAAQLGDADRALIMRVDTFFIASANLEEGAGLARGVDVSHRGGAPGFVRVDNASTLTTPDYSGNRFFNTIGNLLHDPRAGLLFIDFATGDLLYLAVRAEVIWDGAELAGFAGAERLVRFRIDAVRRSRGALPFRWSEVEFAPQFAAAIRQQGTSTSAWQNLKVVEVIEETPSIRSFYFESIDGVPLPPFKPGQFLPIRVPVTGPNAPLVRTYTLSDSYDARRYRISVKREGVASSWLHDRLVVGSRIEAKRPGGTFVYDEDSQRPAVLVSAGIGITPMMAILHHVLHSPEGDKARAKRMFFFHGARSDGERPFSGHLKDVAKRYPAVSVHLFDSAADGSTQGAPAGRMSIDTLKRVLPFDDYDFYLCGPEQFMRDMYDGLRGLNVADERIRFEAFGPASIKRAVIERETPAAASIARGAGVLPVTFAKSARTLQWSPRDGSLLEFAEAHGVDAPSNCRSGTCGTCSTRLLSGRVRYEGEVVADIEAGHALVCVGRPAKGSAPAGVVLDL